MSGGRNSHQKREDDKNQGDEEPRMKKMVNQEDQVTNIKMLGLLQAHKVGSVRKRRERPKRTSREANLNNTSDPSVTAKHIKDIRGYFNVK